MFIRVLPQYGNKIRIFCNIKIPSIHEHTIIWILHVQATSASPLNILFMSQQNQSEGQDDLRVAISASGRADLPSTDGSGVVVAKLIHAITVSQPVQSWTVIRDHLDFITLGTALSTVIAGIPSCPDAPNFAPLSSSPNTNINTNSRSGSNISSDSDSEVAHILKVKSAAQTWLTNVLLFPGARESPAVRQFLCYGANSVPTQYQGIQWFSSNEEPDIHAHASNAIQHDSHSHGANTNANHSVDELEMDDMFGYDDGPGDDEDDEEDDYDDDADFFSATERYQPTIEAVTKDDMMELSNNADDVEMIEDVGSLAQSMGASHLGRSLQLQASVAQSQVPQSKDQFPGLNIGSESKFSDSSYRSGAPLGGIGSAVEKAGIQQEAAINGLSDSFFQKAPISLPRLDSFKMIKVVGKGSFGECAFLYIASFPFNPGIPYHTMVNECLYKKEKNIYLTINQPCTSLPYNLQGKYF